MTQTQIQKLGEQLINTWVKLCMLTQQNSQPRQQAKRLTSSKNSSTAPFGRNKDGSPKAPFGLKKDGTPAKQRGKKSGRPTTNL